MKKQTLLITFILLIISSFCFSYTWENFGPTGYECNNFGLWGGGAYHEIICTSTGILVSMGGDVWDEYTYSNLPCWDAEQVFMATADLIVAMGCGTFSDGIYFFNFITFEFFISEWFLNPRFIYHCWNDNMYYVGGEQGLMKAEDPTSWESVDFFNDKYCYDMVSSYNNYIISTSDGIYYSDDAGENWYPSNTDIFISDLEMGPDDLVYGIFPNTSFSSGLWSSNDYGVNWENEFWDAMMSSVSYDEEANLFVGWEEPNGINEGVAQYFPLTGDYSFMNDGLPNVYVNKLTYHPFLIYPNIICCTDDGTYILSDYIGTGTDESIVQSETLEMSNYPNPFNPNTTISFNLTVKDAKNAKLEIYNLKGQKVKSFPIVTPSPSHTLSITWDGTNENNQPVSSGVYLYKIKAGQFSHTKKMLLMR